MSVMTTAPTSSPHEEARLSLASAAAANERANSPKLLLIGACILLIFGLAYAVTGWSELRAAQDTVRIQRDKVRNASSLISEIQDTFQKQRELIYPPDPGVGKAIETLASELGLNHGPVGFPTSAGQRSLGAEQKRYTITVDNPDPALILSWLVQISEGKAGRGVDLHSIKLTPSKPGQPARWEAIVEFTRWTEVPK